MSEQEILGVGSIQQLDIPRVGFLEHPSRERLAGELIKAQATIDQLTKDMAALPQVKTCADCADLGNLHSKEPCFSCRWNTMLHDNHRK